MNSSLVTHHSSLRFARAVAREALPVLLVLYPLLLLLDDLEPGFVRSVVNPHVFLIALLIAGILTGRTEDDRPLTRNVIFGIALSAAIIGGVWVWWQLQAARTLGAITALFAAVAIGASVMAVAGEDKDYGTAHDY